MTITKRKTLAGSFALTALLMMGVVVHLANRPAVATEGRERIAPQPPVAQMKAAEDLSAVFEYVAETVKPSVVNITSVKTIKPMMRGGQEMPDEIPFPEFFERFLRPDTPRGGFKQQGFGAGVIVSEDGHILTNNHVVADADEVTVTLTDKREYKAKIIGTDPKTDLAVVKIKADNLTPAKLGDSDKVRVGEWVVAVGHPFGLSYTITTGIVSAKGRANRAVAEYEDFIQTDAAINPGNSGGPLLNLKGEVIGINTAIFSRSGGYMGIGFAIPSNMAKSIMQSLMDHGKVVRGWLGVGIQNLDEAMAESFGFEGTHGVLVGDVTPDGPAEKAGFKQGDIIVKFDGKQTKDSNQLRQMVAATSPGTKVEVEVFREGRRETLDVTVGELESGLATIKGREAEDEDLGMTLRSVTPEIAEQLGLKQAKGVVVTKVEPFSAAARAGLRRGDVIVAVQSKPVDTLAEFNEALSRHDLKKGVRLTVFTEGMRRFVMLKNASSDE